MIEVVLFLIQVVIGLIIILICTNNDYKKQREKLMKKIQDLEEKLAFYQENNKEQIHKDDLPQVIDLYQEEKATNKETVENTNINNEIKAKDSINNTQKLDKPKDDEGIKNKFILMAGAVLIVLAAIVFLTSTWHTIPDVIKTSVIILLTGVFIGASNIAKKVFKLEETANTFLYIALAYLPISLFSISLFGLIGDYFSIHGNGNNLYFAISTGILAILYFLIGNRRKQNVLIHSSMIMQLLATIFISLCISINFNIVILGIVIYNTVMLLLKKKYFKEYINILNVYNDIYLYATLIIEICLLINGSLAVDVISNCLLIFNLYLKYKQNKSYITIIMILTQILIFAVSCLNMTTNILEMQIKQTLFYILLIVIYVLGIMNKRIEWKESSMLVVAIAMILLYISTFMFGNITLILKRYMILWTIAIINIIDYNISNRKNLFINLIPIGIFLAQINTIFENNIDINYLILLELGIFAFSILNLLKDKKSNIILQNYSNAMTLLAVIIGFITNYNNMIGHTIIFVLLMIVYGIGYIKNKQIIIYKFIAYFILNIIFYSILYRCNILQYNKYILFMTTVIITLIELYLNKIKDDITIVYLIFSYIISYIILNSDINIISFGAILILDIMFILYIQDKNIDKNLIAIPFVALLPSVYISNWAMIDKTNLMIFASFILIFITTILSVRNEKINVYTVISAIYILMQIFTLKLNIYINLILAIAWSIWHLIKMSTDKTKFEFIAYILGLILYKNILKDCSKINTFIDSITAFKYLGYIIFCICITRNIFKKRSIDGYKVIEYIIFSILYISAIQNYVSQLDGMIFVFMLICIIIVSYIKKFGPIFFTSTVTVILNCFLLTREFWFSVPWWIYMLIIGSILIIFAIKNELNENRDRELIKNKVKSFTEYIDM